MDAVRDLVLQRTLSGSRPGQRDEKHIIGLCIEGGGMRGVVSAGMVLAIEQLGLLDAFDRIYGASAGALNGAYLLAGQAAFGTTIYYENINNRGFIDFARLLRGKPVVDLDYLVKQVMVHDKPLDCEAVLSRGIPLSVIASHVETGKPVILPTDGPVALREALRAGATMPVIAGAPYEVGGNGLWDASMTEPIPTRLAADDGCTHLVVLLTRPRGHLRPGITWIDRAFIVPRLARHSRAIADRYLEGERDYRALIESFDRPDTSPPVLAIRPPMPRVGKLEKNVSRLMQGARGGMAAVFAAFGVVPATLLPVLRGFDERGQLATLRVPARSAGGSHADG